MTKITRRTFLATIAISNITATSAIAGDVENSNMLRPPGAVAEDEFLAKCNRCQRCVQVCPTEVVQPASLEYGFVRMNTPVIYFKENFCNSCIKCPQVCPTGALQPVTEQSLDIGIAKIIEKDCVAWDYIGCTVCVDKCPLKAIYLDDSKRPVVIPEKCNGCGICQIECPSTSLGRNITGIGIIVIPRNANTPPREVI